MCNSNLLRTRATILKWFRAGSFFHHSVYYFPRITLWRKYVFDFLNSLFKCPGEHILIGLLMATNKTPNLVFYDKRKTTKKNKETLDFLHILVLYFPLSFLWTLTSKKEIVLCCSSSRVYFKDGCRLNKDFKNSLLQSLFLKMTNVSFIHLTYIFGPTEPLWSFLS